MRGSELTTENLQTAGFRNLSMDVVVQVADTCFSSLNERGLQGHI